VLTFLLTFVGVCLLNAQTSPDSAPQERSVEVEGSASMDKDANAAKKAAIDDALWRAVREVLGKAVEPGQVQAHVKTYRVIEGNAEGGRYVVKLLVTVLQNPNTDDNRRQLRWSGNPRIMVVVPETLLGHPHVPDPAGETELIRQLVEAKLRVIESSDISSIRYSEDMGHIVKESDIKAMKALGAKYQCDILIAGEAFAEELGRTVGDFISARARIEVKGFIVDTGEILVAHGESAGGADITPTIAGKKALRNAAALLAKYVVPNLKDAIVGKTRVITVQITNLYSASQLDTIEAALKKTAGVEAVQRRNFNSSTETATLDVEANLLTAQLSKELLALSDPLLTVMNSTGQVLEVEVVRR
jgi:hypothetical protein